MTYSIKQALFDPFDKGAYLLASDGTNSAAWYSPDIYAGAPTWAKGAGVIGLYTVIRATKTANNIMIYAPVNSSGATWTQTFDFTINNGGFTANSDAGFSPTTRAVYTAGVGWTQTVNQGVAFPNNYWAYIAIDRSISSTTLTDIAVTYQRTAAGNSLASEGASALPRFVLSVNGSEVTNQDGIAESGTITLSGSWAASTTLTLALTLGFRNDSVSVTSTGKITKIVLSGTGTNPFGGGAGNAVVRWSGNAGGTFDPEITIGTTPGSIGGFDVQLAGAVSYAAMAGKVRKATTLGGAYADWINTTGANAVCLIIPWYTRNSTTAKNTTTATPDCLVALDAADSDGGTLYWVAGATGVKTDITPAAGMTFDSPNCITTSYGTHIAVFGKVGGVYHLYTSVNGGTAWTDQGTLTTPHFIRTRRKDTRAVAGGNNGQIYVTNGNPIDYSRDWGATEYPRTMPVTGVLGHDIAG